MIGGGDVKAVAFLRDDTSLAGCDADTACDRNTASDRTGEGFDATDCGCSCTCPAWQHGWSATGKFLYLRTRNAEIVHAAETDPSSVIPPGIPIQQQLGVVDQDYDPGFRFDINLVLDNRTSAGIAYTMFESRRFDRINNQSPSFAIQSNLMHPGTTAATASANQSTAQHDITFDIVDAYVRRLISWDCSHQINLLAGARYVTLEQGLTHTTDINGGQALGTDIDFQGLGACLGMEGEWYTKSRRWLICGKGFANFVAGEIRADYQQTAADLVGNESLPNTRWRGGRIVTQLDLELGVGYMSPCGAWRLTAGYLLSGWYNTVKTSDWIHAVQTDNYLNLSDAISFEGLIARVEGPFLSSVEPGQHEAQYPLSQWTFFAVPAAPSF